MNTPVRPCTRLKIPSITLLLQVIKVWNALTFESIGEHRGHAEAVTCLALDANFLFSGAQQTPMY
jgi:hypothetical protein